ncbi:MAG: UDP-3-O-(3-hydroxymyristoyl)glucosamine N-acyltransferase [Thermoanaerobaculia bacterium]|nr:UDP-3-O-(3-hydroxymyristoyl)glucosamine N-acyltransferase [Thermoanaerobaculia bacterium]
MVAVRLCDIVELVGGAFSGDSGLEITGVKTLADARPSDISFLGNPKYDAQVASSAAGAILVSRKHTGESPRLVRVDDPYVALATILTKWFAAVPGPAIGVSPLASVAPTARLGSGVAIGPFVTVGENAEVGDDCVIFDGCSIGANARVGRGSLLYPNVTIYHGCILGERNIVHAGAVIGSDGYGFATTRGRHMKIPQIGIVRVGDDVEIGASTTIDRAALGETVIGDGTKIDNLVQIGHNVRVGKHCLLVSLSGIAGSSELGDYCVLAGQAGLVGHIKLGNQVVVTAQAAVTKDWEGPIQLSGSPARPLGEKLRSDATIARMPKQLARVKELERRVAELERKLADKGE